MLFNLAQTFWLALHKLLTLFWWNFGPFLLKEPVELGQICGPSCMHMHMHNPTRPQMFSWTVVRLCFVHPNTFWLLYIWKTCQWFAGWCLVVDVDCTYPQNILPLCHLFGEIHQSAGKQHHNIYAATTIVDIYNCKWSNKTMSDFWDQPVNLYELCRYL